MMLRLLCIVMLVLVAWPASAQQEEITAGTPLVIDGLREGALKQRAQAEASLSRARQWRDMAGRARQHASESQDRAFAASRIADADQYDGFAQRLEDEAAALIKKSDADEARANRLEAAVAAKNAPPPPAPATTSSAKAPADKDAPSLDDVLGLWETVDGPNFSIAILSAAGPGKPPTPDLVAHTAKRVWKGRFTGDTDGPIVRLSYTPKLDEMNPEIPDWARKAIEGRLVWRLELDLLGETLAPSLGGRWYAGEVSWDESARSVEITGDGKPWVFELEPAAAIAVDAMMRPLLGIRLKTSEDYDADAHPPEALTQGQLFSPYLTLPAEMARAKGPSIVLTVTGTTHGATESIKLKARGRIGLRPVTYMPDEPVMIGDCAAMMQARRNPRTGSFQWLRRSIAGERAQGGSTFWTFIAGDDPGPCLDMRVANGETLEFRAEGAVLQLPLYDSWVQHGVARHQVLAQRQKAALLAVAGGAWGAPAKSAAETRLRMLENYRSLVASDKLTDLHRFYLGEFYFGDVAGPAIMLMTDAQLAEYYDDEMHRRPHEQSDPGFLNPVMKAFLEGLTGKDLTPKSPQAGAGVAWTSAMEEQLVIALLRQTSDQIAGNAVQTWIEQMSFGGYEGYVAATGAGQLWLVATGADHHGRRQSGWDRLFAAVGLASNAILQLAGAEAEEAFAMSGKSAPLGREAEAESAVLGKGIRRAEEVDSAAALKSLPASLSAAEREELFLQTVADAERGGPPAGCTLRSKKTVAASTLMEVRAAAGAGGFDPFVDLAERWRIEDYIASHWGPETKVVSWTDQPLQELQGFDRPTCNAMAANRLIFTRGGTARTQTHAQAAITKIMFQQVREFGGPAGGISFGSGARKGNRVIADLQRAPGWLVGFDNLAIRDYLRAEGATVTEIKASQNTKLKLRHIWSALEKGYGVKIIVDFKKRAGAVFSDPHALHAVVVDGMIIGTKNGRPAVNAVRVYDSNVGRLIDVPARIFNEVLARDYHEGIMTLVKFEPKSP